MGTIPPEALRPHRRRLLATAPEDVSPSVRETLSVFCAAAPEVEAAYVCRVERVWPDRKPEQTLSFAMKLTTPIREPGDAQPEKDAIRHRLIRQHPDLARELGIGVLADRAVPAWQKNAQKIYSAP